MPGCILECRDHPVDYILARQDVALRRAVSTVLMTRPGCRLWTGESRCFSFGVNDGELPPLFGPIPGPGVGVGLPDLFEYVFGRDPLPQQRYCLGAVAYVDYSLCRRGAYTGLSPQHTVTDREYAGLDRAADFTGRRIKPQYRKSCHRVPRLRDGITASLTGRSEIWRRAGAINTLVNA